MSSKRKAGDATTAAHAGRRSMENFGVVNPPVYHASTILHPTIKSWEGRKEGSAHKQGKHSVIYGRMGTPTQFALRDALSIMEGAADTELLPSGMAACAICFMALAEPGAHFLIPDNVYLPVRSFATGMLSRVGCETSFYDPLIGKDISDLIRPTTKMIWLEAPGSMTFEMPDLPAIVSAAKEKNVLTGIDNTWGAGFFLKPMELGIDFSAHALTKYPCGHSDAMLGSVSCATQELYEILNQTTLHQGLGVSPDDCYLVQRGLRTMPTRLEQHYRNGVKVAQWLAERPEVIKVLHPALPSDPGHHIWKRDFSGACGLFGVILDAPDREGLAAMVEGYDYFGIGASWGGFESLCITGYPEKIRTATNWQAEGQVLRYHIGLEDTDDLIRDLERGFERLSTP